MGNKGAPETRKPVEAWVDSLLQQTREHPGRSVAMAVGVGYVLGGGLLSRLTAVLGQRHTTQRETKR